MSSTREMGGYSLAAVMSLATYGAIYFTLSGSAFAQPGNSGTDLILRGMSEFSQSMAEMNDCKNKFRGDPSGYWNCYQGANTRQNQRTLQWQMELQESIEADQEKAKEQDARERCADREDDRAWALCMKRYGGR